MAARTRVYDWKASRRRKALRPRLLARTVNAMNRPNLSYATRRMRGIIDRFLQ